MVSRAARYASAVRRDLRTVTAAELPSLRDLFARANDAPYDLVAVAEEKCFGAGVSGAPVVRAIERGGRIAAAAVISGKWLRVLAVDRDERGRGLGTALLADAEAHGASVIAAEPGNYFLPGAPETLRPFFERRGYTETAATWNLHTPLPAPSAQHRAPSAQHPAPVSRANHAEAPKLLQFINDHFGSIWRFEAAKAFERDVPPLFIAWDGGEPVGFAAHEVNNRGLGWFGPTGVAKAQRGRGLGCRLLLASLADLHAIGYARAVIPWTDALPFYERCCGAKPASRLIAFTKLQP